MGKRAGEMVGFGEVLSGLKLPKNVKDHLKNHEIWSRWAEIVGPELGRVTSPLELKAKTLTVSVVHQAWAHQLHFLTPSILNKIRAICPGSSIQDLHFRVGPVRVVAPVSKKDETPIDRTSPVKLTERLEMTLRAIEDLELRSVVRRAMESAARRSSSKN